MGVAAVSHGVLRADFPKETMFEQRPERRGRTSQVDRTAYAKFPGQSWGTACALP